MGLIDLSLPLVGPQQIPPRPDQRWLSRGLKSAYLLQPGLWNVNLVTGRIGGATSGAGFSFVNGKLRSTGSASDYALLAHGLSTSVALPITLCVGWTRISGAVSWSLLRLDTGDWFGWYGEGDGTVKTSNANSFDGLLSLGITNSVAFAHRSATELVGHGRGVSRVADSTATAPSSLNTTDITLGVSRRNGADNPAQADFTHVYAFQASLSDGELAELANEPERLWEPRRIWIPVGAAGGGGDVAASVSASASTSAALTTSIRPAASVSVSASSSAPLTTSILVAASAGGTATAAASLTTGIRAAAAVSGTAAVSAALTTVIRAAASVSGTATASASLTTSVRMAASVSGSATTAADLAAGASNAIAAAVVGQASASAALTTAVRMQASVAASAATSADLTTSAAAWAAAVVAQASASAALTTAIRMAAVANASATASAAISGGAAEISTMPPYVTVYLWKRTA